MANSKDSNSRVFKIWIIASWYFSNISILFLNKYLLTNNGFKCPIFLTMCHMTACSLLSYVAIMWMKMVPMQKLRENQAFIYLGLIFAWLHLLQEHSSRCFKELCCRLRGMTDIPTGDDEFHGTNISRYYFLQLFGGRKMRWASALVREDIRIIWYWAMPKGFWLQFSPFVFSKIKPQ